MRTSSASLPSVDPVKYKRMAQTPQLLKLNMKAFSRPNKPTSCATMAGPKPRPRSSVKLKRENAAPRWSGGLTWMTIARTFTPVYVHKIPAIAAMVMCVAMFKKESL